MITLYHCIGSRSFRPLWALEELELPFRLNVLPFPPRERAREFLKVNPLGTIPFFVDGSVTMTESSAICQYLALRDSGKALSVSDDDPEFGTYLNAMYFGEATLTFPIAIFMRYSRLEPPERLLPQAAEDYRRFFLGRLRGVAQRLKCREYFCADRFTVADISVGYALLFAANNGLRPDFPKGVSEYLDRLQARGGFQRALLAEQRASQRQIA